METTKAKWYDFLKRRAGSALRSRSDDTSRQWLLGAIEAHRQALTTGEGVLKNEPKASISRIRWQGRSAVVKHYRYKGLRFLLKGLFKRHPGRQSVQAANAMRGRSILTPKVLGLLERGFAGLTTQSWLVTEDIPGAIEMDRYLVRHFPEPGDFRRRRRFVAVFAGVLRRMMLGGFRHGDLKTCNVLVVERDDSWCFAFIDLDDVTEVSASQPVSRNDWVLALAQLNSSTPKSVTRSDRLRFLDRVPELQAFDRAALIADIQKISRSRGRVYLSDDGPVVEEFV